MIKLASFKPEFFDNNGDQGNIAVLATHLSAIGQAFELSGDCNESDFLMIGDSSIAVHEHYQRELSELLPELKLRLLAGKPTLLVGRSWEYFAPLLGVELSQGSRESKFVQLKVANHEVIGYHNSTVVEPRFFISGAFIGTTLFGPLLAKNPSVLKLLGSSLGVEFEGEFFRESERLANLVREATTF
jgi:CobQ-like glutamine amidotransferase family enzyme